MIQPILLYGCELWGLYGWKKDKQILGHLLNGRHPFEDLHSKMCRNALGVHRRATECLVISELGRYPLMINVVKHIYSYWQHVLNSKRTSLVRQVLESGMTKTATGHLTYVSRIKMLFETLEVPHLIQKSDKICNIKKKGSELKNKLRDKYKKQFFELLKCKKERLQSGGRFEVYFDIKKQYKFEKYLLCLKNDLRRHITNIRISTHNLPVEVLRKKGIKRDDRICKLCTKNVVCTELHAVMFCENDNLVEFRNNLNIKLNEIKPQWNRLSKKDKFIYLTLANDKECFFYFAIFLDKMYKLFNANM